MANVDERFEVIQAAVEQNLLTLGGPLVVFAVQAFL